MRWMTVSLSCSSPLSAATGTQSGDWAASSCRPRPSMGSTCDPTGTGPAIQRQRTSRHLNQRRNLVRSSPAWLRGSRVLAICDRVVSLRSRGSSKHQQQIPDPPRSSEQSSFWVGPLAGRWWPACGPGGSRPKRGRRVCLGRRTNPVLD